jgi:uncharacterized protein
MLVAFSVENYRSFKERVTFSLVAADLSSKPKDLDSTNVFLARDDLKLLTSAAVYGANASGKSNLVAALRFMRRFVLNSSRETRLRQPINVLPYRLSTETEKAPSRFEIVFVQQQVIYRYGFLVSRKQVEEEWLYTTTSKKEANLFDRTLDKIKVNERSFKEGQGLQERTRPNALFLSVAAQWNGKRAGQISEWFEKLTVNTGVDDSTRRQVDRYETDELPPEVIAFVRGLDLGIEDMRLERRPPQEVSIQASDGSMRAEMLAGSTNIRTVHTKYDSAGEPVAKELFDLLTHESQGTRRLFVLAQPILTALRTGTVFVVDEIDARLHPTLTCAIIRLFNSPETNPKHAQLIFTTHDTNLLGSELFRRDQIWFVEKSRRGESTLYSLVEYKVRNDAAYEKNYIAGRYGAIPYLGSLIAAIGVEDAEQADIEADIEEEAGSEINDSDLSPAPDGDEG